MKNDYLWDKTGTDPEIERLEGLLAEFRYSVDPAAASNVIEFPGRVRSDLKPWIFSIAACIAVAASALGLWSFYLTGGDAAASDVAQVQTETEEVVLPVIPLAEPETKTKVTAVNPRSPTAARPQKASLRSRSGRAVQQRIKEAHAPSALTKEERFAYNQLMLALSITSSNLQTVRRSIDGNEISDTEKR